MVHYKTLRLVKRLMIAPELKFTLGEPIDYEPFNKAIYDVLSQYQNGQEVKLRRLRGRDKQGFYIKTETKSNVRDCVLTFNKYFGIGTEMKESTEIKEEDNITIQGINLRVIFITDLLKTRHKKDIWNNLTNQ